MFEEYLEKYCMEYGVSKEVALTHKTVLDVKDYYEHRDEVVVVKKEVVDCGC